MIESSEICNTIGNKENIMKNIIIYLAVAIFTYTLGNYYVGHRGWQFFSNIVSNNFHWAYWSLFWIIAVSFIIGSLGARISKGSLSSMFYLIGSVWMAAILYFLICLALLDITKFILKKLIKPDTFKFITSENVTIILGVVIIGAVVCFLVIGYLNVIFSKVNTYQILISKKSSIARLQAVLVSDVHMGSLIGKKYVETLVERINELKPDIVMFAGDTIDGDVRAAEKIGAEKILSKIKARYGVYGVYGNHEYFGNGIHEAREFLAKSGIKILVDEAITIKNTLVIAGRDDLAKERFSEGKRKSLEEILAGVDRQLPIILMDHQPTNLEDAKKNEVDLQVSGHTHHGQLFPFNYITRKIFEIDWGHLKKGNTNVIVSSGYGIWGPPIRTVNRSEIVRIDIKFKK